MTTATGIKIDGAQLTGWKRVVDAYVRDWRCGNTLHCAAVVEKHGDGWRAIVNVVSAGVDGEVFSGLRSLASAKDKADAWLINQSIRKPIAAELDAIAEAVDEEVEGRG